MADETSSSVGRSPAPAPRSARRSRRIVLTAVAGAVVVAAVVLIAVRATGQRAGLADNYDFPVRFSCGGTNFKVTGGFETWSEAKGANLVTAATVQAACGFGTRWSGNGWGGLKKVWGYDRNRDTGFLALRIADHLKCRVGFAGDLGYFEDCTDVSDGSELHPLVQTSS